MITSNLVTPESANTARLIISHDNSRIFLLEKDSNTAGTCIWSTNTGSMFQRNGDLTPSDFTDCPAGTAVKLIQG